SLPATRALGLRELRRHLAGEIDLATAIAEAKTATTRYAKRQATWFRHQIRADHVIAPQHIDRQFLERFLPEILSKIRHLVLTPWG
ncbi:MAG: tRNA (adenosine(37)-N6)-dimethylallyltransferase MiaA, partial [Alphaproteobacteria bacterium]|nr:tRNA (adenosine(37)-N6)-dimethylallyltransferase MiaA [Alphaproteobacteria bacterium]